MIEHKYPIEIRPADLRPWLAPQIVQGITPLPGWHNSIFRVDTTSGERFVLRVHVPDEPFEYIAPTLRIVDACSIRLSYVHAPIRTRSGSIHSEIRERVATLWPFAEGVVPEELNDCQRLAAARVLAEIHQAGEHLVEQAIVRPTWRFGGIDWQSNRRWRLPRLAEFLRSPSMIVPHWLNGDELIANLESASKRVVQQIGTIPESAFVDSVAHGDFYPANLLFDENGEIVAVLDWDDARIDWTGWDIANALLEFCAGPAGLNLDPERCTEFIGEYERSAGSLSDEGRAALPSLLRARKLDEFAYSLDEMTKFGHADWEYLHSSLDAWHQVQRLEQV